MKKTEIRQHLFGRSREFSVIALFVLSIGWVGLDGSFPLMDDWSYALTALSLGRADFRPDNWGGVSLFGQSVIGAVAGNLFGWTYPVLRTTTFIVSISCLLILLRFAGPERRRSGAAQFVLGGIAFFPVFLLSSVTFMTDMYFAVYFLLAVFWFVSYAEGKKRRGSLTFATFFSVAATLVRQLGVVPPLAFAHLSLSRNSGPGLARFRGFLPLLSTSIVMTCYDAALFYSGRMPANYNFPIFNRVEQIHGLLNPGHPPTPRFAASILYYGAILFVPFVTVAIERLVVKLLKNSHRPARLISYSLLVFTVLALCIHFAPLDPVLRRATRQPADVIMYVGFALLPATTICLWFAKDLGAFRQEKWILLRREILFTGAALVASIWLLGGRLGGLPASVGNYFIGPLTILTDGHSLPKLAPVIWGSFQLGALFVIMAIPILVFAFRSFVSLGKGADQGAAYFAIVWVLYFVLIVTSGIHDRWVLPLAIIPAAFLMRNVQVERVRLGRRRLICLAALTIVPGLLWTGALRDYMNWNRARWVLSSRALELGAQPANVSAGMEFDGVYNFDPRLPVECRPRPVGKVCLVANKLTIVDPYAVRFWAVSLGSLAGRKEVEAREVKWSFGGSAKVVLSQAEEK